MESIIPVMANRNQNFSSQIVPIFILISITVLCLAPFANKAFNIDEPLFIWTAKQIHLHPLDFYGFRINWYGTAMDASRIIKNPPFASYYLSLAASLFGWNELQLHLAFLLPAIAAVLGTYFLARRFTQNPVAATVIGIVNPVFILSSSTVMCDTMMLAFYLWAIFFWVRGIKEDRGRDLFIAAVLIALSSLTKYFGVSLIPLLFLYTIFCGGDKGKRALFLLIPVLILGLYQWETYLLYGRGLLSDAASYATREKGTNFTGIFASFAIGLSFTGGCLITACFFAMRLWSKRIFLAAAVLIPGAAWALSWINLPHVAQNASWGYYLQLSFFMAAGLNLLVVAALDFGRKQDPDALLLGLWVLGTFLFASFINWSVNGRSILPMVPAAAMVVMRSIEQKSGDAWQAQLKSMALPVACAYLLSMAVTWADFKLAGTARTAATVIAKSYGTPGRPSWFQGHWGFQYYMDENGASAFDRKNSSLQPADVMVVAENNTNFFPEINDQGSPLRILEFMPASFLSTMNYNAGAGYYSSGFGALPFLVGSGFVERYHIFVFRRAVKA